LTILKKRDGYRHAFANFDAKKVARYDDAKQAALLTESGIVRHRQKIRALVENAKALLIVQQEFGSFDAYIWEFVDSRPIISASDSKRSQPPSGDHSPPSSDRAELRDERRQR